MPFHAPVADQRFLLDTVVRIGELEGEQGFPALSGDIVDAILEGAAQFAEGEFAPLNRIGDTEGSRWTPEGVKMPKGYHEAYQAYVEGGWGTINGPEAHGGQGLPFTLATAVFEDLCAANMGFSLIMMLTPGAVESLVTHGSTEQQDIWLPKLISGEWNGTMCLTEPQAGSDVGALRTQAVPVGDGSFLIKGTKIYITYGDHDLTGNVVHLVLARTPGAPEGTRGISLFLVPKVRLDGTPNDVRSVSIEHKLGINVSPTCVMSFGDNDDCLGWLVGPENGGMRAMFTMMNNARLNVGLQGVAIAERARQQAVDYARDRVQSARAGSASRDSVPIVQHPDVRRMLLRMTALTMAGRALIYYAAGQADRAHLGDRTAQARLDVLTPLAKAHGTDIGCEVTSLGVQVHGGMGFVEETGAAQHYRDARIAPIYEGTNGIQAADLVGRKLALEGGAPMAALIADMRADIGNEPALTELIDAVDEVIAWMATAGVEDKLAGSYPLLTMLSVAVEGWLMTRQEKALDQIADPEFRALKQAAIRFFLDRIVPEALGHKAGAMAGAALLYDVPEEALAI